MFKEIRHYFFLTIIFSIPIYFVGTILAAYLLEFVHLKSPNDYFSPETQPYAMFIAYLFALIISLKFFPLKSKSSHKSP